jgi:hypothetical protein
MKKLLFLAMILLVSISCFSQEKTKVFLLGTYHFGGHTPDEHKVANDLILSDKKQGQLRELLNKLEKFNPERIYVESEVHRQKRWDSLYAEYLNGKDHKIENEIYQIGIKLAGRLKLKQGVTCVDWQVEPANTPVEKLYLELAEKIASYHEENYVPSENEMLEHAKQISKKNIEFNEKIPHMNIVEVFRRLNSDNYLNDSFYMNRLEMLESDELSLMAFWSQNQMARDVKIYQKVMQDILKHQPKRVMLIIGAGHVVSLKNFFETHPTIEVVEVSRYLK